ADTVAGLRVLRGIGGETVFAQRYGTRSELVRRAGVKLARTESLLDAVAVLLPGLFLALLTWAGARLVLAGTVEPGALVALYGYAFFLVIPVRTAAEMAFILTRALVAARRMLAVLAVQPDVADAGTVAGPADEPPAGSVVLVDPACGLEVPAGQLTMLVADDPSTTVAVADRLGRLVPDSAVRLDGVPLAELPLAEVRRRIVVSDPEPTLFTGTLRSGLDPHGYHGDADLIAAMEAAAAGDVLDTLRDGLDSIVEERGRSLSGGQRQRVGLARVLVADPEVLVLVEPTSAVDAHTEAAIARTLRQARSGRTTVVVTASPLMLAQADSVVWLDDGQVSAVGSHEELLATVSSYRYTVTREEDAA
ncbi:MAG: ATP-binding cassette domain-containing protein, partial [Jiangellaceae bacterium]